MSETTATWKNKRIWLLALPALAATVVSLIALEQTVVGGAGQGVAGDPLGGWRQSALQLELNLAVDPERRAAIEVALSATAPSAETSPTQEPAVGAPAVVTVTPVPGVSGSVNAPNVDPTPAVPRGVVPVSSATSVPPTAVVPAASPTQVAPPTVLPATSTQAPTQVPPTAPNNSGPSPSNTPRPTDVPAASQPPKPTDTAQPTATAEPTETAQPEEVRLTGTLEATGGTWVIAGQSVIVNGGTEIRDNPVVGDTVEVRAWRYPDGTWVAYRIKKD